MVADYLVLISSFTLSQPWFLNNNSNQISKQAKGKYIAKKNRIVLEVWGLHISKQRKMSSLLKILFMCLSSGNGKVTYRENENEVTLSFYVFQSSQLV